MFFYPLQGKKHCKKLQTVDMPMQPGPHPRINRGLVCGSVLKFDHRFNEIVEEEQS